MADDTGSPFAFWQTFWQNATPPALAPMLPPMTLEDVKRKISELKSVETWLNLNLQMVQSQLVVLEQQKLMHESMQEFSANLARSIESAKNEFARSSESSSDDSAAANPHASS